MEKIFKTYDIRGIYPKEINEDLAYKAGMAFALLIKEKYPEYDNKIGVARDSRISSEPLFSALVRGINDMGGNVIDFGMISTPMLYFCSWFYNLSACVMITASHNPKEYNGIKFVGPEASPIYIKNGMDKIRDMVLKNDFSLANQKGSISKKDCLQDYLDNVLSGFLNDDFSDFKICVDTANAVGIIPLKPALQEKRINADYIFQEIDGNFPNHPSDPTDPPNLIAIKEKMKSGQYDLGIALDGDGDRIVFIDEQGNDLVPDIITALMAKIILKDNPKEKILYDISSTKAVLESIEKYGGEPAISVVGHSLIKTKMREENIFFGGEKSGHYYLQANKYCEVPFFVLFSILKYIKQSGKKFSEITSEFRTYFSCDPISIDLNPDADINAIYQALKEKYSNGQLTDIDGIRIDFDDWWFLVRKSNTEPLLRLTIESKDKDILLEKEEEIRKIISQ